MQSLIFTFWVGKLHLHIKFGASFKKYILLKIKEVTGDKKGMEAFVKFPFALYKSSKYWVPPIIADELESFDPAQNPVFEHAEARFFLAEKENKIVGRVAAIINNFETENQGIKKMRFGWLDFEDDFEVSKALIDAVKKIGIEHQLSFMEGPLGFSNLDKVGLMTFGFDHIGTMVTWYNYPYYAGHLEKMGFFPEKNYLESKFQFEDIKQETFQKVERLITERYKLKTLNFTKTKDLLPYADKMFELFNASYSKLSSFVAISPKQQEFFKKKYLSFINPEYIKFVLDSNDKLIGFGIIMPSFSEALQKANGRLFPFGFLHLLWAKAKAKVVNFYLIGVHPDYQNKGIHALIFNAFYDTVKAKGVHTFIRTPELADNVAIHNIFKDFNPVVHVKRSTFRLDL